MYLSQIFSRYLLAHPLSALPWWNSRSSHFIFNKSGLKPRCCACTSYSWPIGICSARTAGLRVWLNARAPWDMGSKLNTEGLGRYHSLPVIFPIVIKGSKLHTYYATRTFPRSSHSTLGSRKGHCYHPEPIPLLQHQWTMESTAPKPQSQTCTCTLTLPTTPHHQQDERVPWDDLATPQGRWKMLYLILWLHIACSLSGLSTRQVDFQNMWTPSQHPQPTVLISQGHRLVPAETYVEFVGKSCFCLAPCLHQWYSPQVASACQPSLLLIFHGIIARALTS